MHFLNQLLAPINIPYHSFSVHPATFGANALFMNTTTFTYGESSGAVHQEMLNISSIHGNEFASVILQPIPKDRDVIRIANAEAFIKISVHSKNSYQHRLYYPLDSVLYSAILYRLKLYHQPHLFIMYTCT